MTNNTWTLIKHLAGSLNHAAAHVDRVVYGPVLPPPPPPPMSVWEMIGQGLIGVLGLVILFVWIFRFQNGVDRVKERIMR